MLNLLRPTCARSVLFCLLLTAAASSAKAQTTQETPLDRQLARVDLGIVAVGVFNKQSNGTAIVNAVPTQINLTPANTAGAVVTLRYVAKPYFGLEGNYTYARYTENFTPFGTQPTGGVQQNASEYSFGYVAHTRKQYHGWTPFASAGLGSIAFRPTSGGGLALPKQARAAYYFSVGAETNVFSPHFGVRAMYRQVFFKAPDFETNYLTIQQHTTTYEPGFGFFLRF